jgi:hypothetical protein
LFGLVWFGLVWFDWILILIYSRACKKKQKKTQIKAEKKKRLN